ncbi:hypothetical protein BJ878DRAFT_524094 [Calycina marina]|uniref:Endoplasmic reticulum junction formation protein lunapark n=1 Tax=Calycina marina TaxID=1763456 RepID=A0A9P8CBP4_9HELO|nr:hypothetical protein BJ878DRAFT_524094 [Calycina marina]
MVSLWPWKGENTSPASFEKALSALAVKITKSQTQLDFLWQRARRAKGLWTVYSSFAYLLCFIILFLVVGWKNWTVWEYTAVSGSPLIIWIIRTAITSYYTYRIDILTQRLETQQADRQRTIDKLKAATKYNSTQELLEKYGGATPKPKPKRSSSSGNVTKPAKKVQAGRMSLGPPPTANIPRPGNIPVPQPATPQQITPPQQLQRQPYITPQPPISSADFAPNAFSSAPQYAPCDTSSSVTGNWYDRVLDLLLGEDETSPRNRIALICQNCRLVNGQAPPGTKTLGELGRWRCLGCGGINGEVDEGVKAVQEMKEKIADVEKEKISEPESAVEAKRKDEVDDDTSRGSDGKDDISIIETTGSGADSAEDMVEVKPRRGRSSRKKA